MAEISSIKPNEATINILDPATSEEIGITVDVMGLDDDRMKRIRRSLTDRRNQSQMKGKITKAEELEDEGTSLLFSAMTGWNWGKDADGNQNTFHGEIPDFNRKNVAAVFDELPWFKRQVDAYIGDDRNFFKSSKPS